MAGRPAARHQHQVRTKEHEMDRELVKVSGLVIYPVAGPEADTLAGEHADIQSSVQAAATFACLLVDCE